MSDQPDKGESVKQGEPMRARRKGVYLLPNLLTTAGLFSGFFAIIAATSGHYEKAAIAIFVAMLMDGLDGRVARLTNTQSDFGVQYDSLADMVSFGMAPALVMYLWALKDLDPTGFTWAKFGWLAAFVYAAGGALRLARFNTQVGSADKAYFQGLASPAAAGVIAGLVWFSTDYGIQGPDLRGLAVAFPAVLGLLMISNVRYHSFKDLDLRKRVPFTAVFVVVGLLVLASIKPSVAFFVGFLVYAISGPIQTVVGLRRRRSRKQGG